MTIDRLRHARRASPFQPFTICMRDGTRFFVRSPLHIMVPPKARRTVMVVESGEDYRILDVPLVSSLEFANGKPPDERSAKGRETGRGVRK